MKLRSLLALLLIVSLGGCVGSGSITDTVGQLSDTLYGVATVLCVFVASIFQIAGAIGALIIVFAGLKWIESRDNPAERKKAKEMMIAVLVGLVIIYVGVALVSTVLQQSFECSETGVTQLVH